MALWVFWTLGWLSPSASAVIRLVNDNTNKDNSNNDNSNNNNNNSTNTNSTNNNSASRFAVSAPRRSLPLPTFQFAALAM